MRAHPIELANKVAALVWQANKYLYDIKGYSYYELVLQSETGAWGMEFIDNYGQEWGGNVIWITNQIQLYLDVKEAPEKFVGLLGDQDKYVSLLVSKAFKGEL